MLQTSLKELFSAYANYGTRVPTTELDGAKYVKVFKDAELLGKGLTSTDLDIIFSKVLPLSIVRMLTNSTAGLTRTSSYTQQG